jgi:hypothetical protein
MEFRATRLVPVEMLLCTPRTVVAAEALVFFRAKMEFCPMVCGLAVAVLVSVIPITEAAVVVPVPPAAVKLRRVLVVKLGAAFTVTMPAIWVAVEVALFWMESATVPPMLFPLAAQVTPVPVLARMQ